MKNLLPANRVVLLLHLVFVIATAAGIFIASISHSLPLSWQANVAGGATILGAIASATVAVTKFLDGSQKSEALQARAAPYVGITTGSSTTGLAPAPEPSPDQVLAEITNLEAAQANVQAAPGTPADQVTAGLAPTPPLAAPAAPAA
jgi:hypothetical protein